MQNPLRRTRSAPPSPAVVPQKSYEQGVQAGISAMRQTALEMLQTCSLAGGDDARKVLRTTVSYLRAGVNPDEVRAALASEIVFNMSGGDADSLPVA